MSFSTLTETEERAFAVFETFRDQARKFRLQRLSARASVEIADVFRSSLESPDPEQGELLGRLIAEQGRAVHRLSLHEGAIRFAAAKAKVELGRAGLDSA